MRRMRQICPSCIATDATVAETESLIHEAIEFHLEGLKADGLPIPHPKQPRHIRRRLRMKHIPVSVTAYAIGSVLQQNRGHCTLTR